MGGLKSEAADTSVNMSSVTYGRTVRSGSTLSEAQVQSSFKDEPASGRESHPGDPTGQEER